MSSPFVIILPINICSACFFGHFVDPHCYPVRSIFTSAFHISTAFARCKIHPIVNVKEFYTVFTLHASQASLLLVF